MDGNPSYSEAQDADGCHRTRLVVIRNQQVIGSSPIAGSKRNPYNLTDLATRLASGESFSCPVRSAVR